MTYKTVAFCVVNSDYIDPAIVALTSFFKYNTIPVVCYVENGTNIQRLSQATAGHTIEFRMVEFPQLSIHETLGDKYLELFVSRSCLPIFAQRIKALEEMSKEADIIVNFDLDVLFCNTLQSIVSKCDKSHVYGVSERKNRDRWMANLHLNDIITNPVYINTGLVIYGSDAVSSGLMSDYESFLHNFTNHVYCPEQDFINHRFVNEIREIPAHFNLMFTDERYTQLAPVMIHFLSHDKPWTDYINSYFLTRYYYRRYLSECLRQKQYLSNKFVSKIHEKIDFS